MSDEGRPFGFFDPRLPVTVWAKVTADAETGCWMWTGYLEHHGYGQVRTVPHRGKKAHRVVYAALVGPIPEGLEIDHLCKVRNCVNPAHLKPVTRQENMRRSSIAESRGRAQREKTHCKHGHPFDEANTFHWRGERHCRACDRARQLRYYHARKGATA